MLSPLIEIIRCRYIIPEELISSSKLIHYLGKDPGRDLSKIQSVRSNPRPFASFLIWYTIVNLLH